MELRPYQNDILNQLRVDWKSHQTHLIQAPTGAGKTVIGGTVVKGFYDRGMRILFTCPRTALIDQTVQAFFGMGIHDIGVIQADHEMTDPTKKVQVGTVQTLARRGYDDFDAIIVDECHLNNTKLIEHIENSGVKTIGLTATPYAHWLGNVYENFIKKVTMKDLMDQGYLSNYEFFAPTKPNLKGVSTRQTPMGADYAENEIAEIMGDAKIAGDIISTWLANGENRPTIAFCCNVLHANFLTVEFRKIGVSAEVVVGSTPKDERKRIFKEFKAGIVKVICSVEVLVEGFDADVRAIIYAKPTKSEARWVQAIGRSLRLADGKDKALIFDHSGTVIRLGMPHEIEYEELFSDKDQYNEAYDVAVKEKSEKKSKECPSCNYIKPAGEYICSKCGFKPLYGEDGDVDEAIELKSLSSTKITKQDKQKFYSELLGYQAQRIRNGKKCSDGYISHIYKGKFDVWPRTLSRHAVSPSPETLGYIKSRQIAYAKRKQK